MKRHRIAALVFSVLVLAAGEVIARGVELPQHYFQLMEAELKSLDPDSARSNPGAMFAAAVLYSKEHPANPSFGDPKKLALALRPPPCRRRIDGSGDCRATACGCSAQLAARRNCFRIRSAKVKMI
jgi:hypothetical protein